MLEELLLEIDDTYTHSKTFVVSPQQHFQKNSTAHKGKLTCAQAKNNKPPVAAVGKSITYACCYWEVWWVTDVEPSFRRHTFARTTMSTILREHEMSNVLPMVIFVCCPYMIISYHCFSCNCDSWSIMAPRLKQYELNIVK